jgi:hypothetical protein
MGPAHVLCTRRERDTPRSPVLAHEVEVGVYGQYCKLPVQDFCLRGHKFEASKDLSFAKNKIK